MAIDLSGGNDLPINVMERKGRFWLYCTEESCDNKKLLQTGDAVANGMILNNMILHVIFRHPPQKTENLPGL